MCTNHAITFEPIFQFDSDPFSSIEREFEVKMKNSKFKPKSSKKSRFHTYLETFYLSENRHEKLRDFLAEKIFQYNDKINLMILPELRQPLIDINIIKLKTEKIVEKNRFGSTSCRLDRVANSTIVWKLECENIFKIDDKKCKWKKHSDDTITTTTTNNNNNNNLELTSNVVVPVPVCPWHWNIITRSDRFPFKRSLAICNCEHCQAKTIYDSKINKVSYCKPEFVLMPALVRESLVNGIEKWKFYMEEVPTSCTCSINRLKPIMM